jgi:predicted Holliday junction resolvase-like endonuclease
MFNISVRQYMEEFTESKNVDSFIFLVSLLNICLVVVSTIATIPVSLILAFDYVRKYKYHIETNQNDTSSIEKSEKNRTEQNKTENNENKENELDNQDTNTNNDSFEQNTNSVEMNEVMVEKVEKVVNGKPGKNMRPYLYNKQQLRHRTKNLKTGEVNYWHVDYDFENNQFHCQENGEIYNSLSRFARDHIGSIYPKRKNKTEPGTQTCEVLNGGSWVSIKTLYH